MSRIFLIASLLFWSPLAASSEGHDGVPVTQVATDPMTAQIETAAALLRSGQWNPAFAILGPLTVRDARAGNMLFDTGMVALELAHRSGIGVDERDAFLDVSIAAFQAILAANPELTRIRLELARAFFLKGQDGLARRHFERVLAGDVPAPVVANVNRFLAEIRARRRWSAYGGIGLAPDTNIGAVTARREQELNTFLGELPFTYSDTPTSGVGVILWGGWEYERPLAERTQLRFGGNVSRREYAGSRFDRMTLGAQAGPRWLISPGTEASLLATANRHWQGSSASHDELGLRFEGRHIRGRRTLLNFNGALRDRRWKENPDRDGKVVNLGFGIRYQATPVLVLNASVFGERNRDGLANFRTRTRGLSLGASRDLPRAFTVGLEASLNRTRYDEPDALRVSDGGRQEDRTTGLNMNLTKRDLTIRGFSPRLTLGRSVRESNASFADFKRTFGEISFVRQF